MTVLPTSIGLCEIEFHRTGNPLFALGAWQIARANDMQPPDWVMTYLDQSVENIFSVEEPPGNNSGRFISDAFGFVASKGKRSAFSEFARQIEAINIWVAVQRRIEPEHSDGRRDKLYLVFEAVADETGISKSTVERRYYEIQNYLSSLGRD